MSSPSGANFTVDRLPKVDDEIRELAKVARANGRLQEYLNIVRDVLDELEQDPQNWGDPEYHGKSEGSTVCHGIAGPLYVKYVVFEPERVVVIFQVRAMPNSWLD
jgi:hypothetical protein